jgi:Zn-dependent M28 family amino/carboxypeptidase
MKPVKISIFLAIITILITSACQPQNQLLNNLMQNAHTLMFNLNWIFGYRIPVQTRMNKFICFIKNELRKAGWKVEVEDLTYEGHPVKNITAKRGNSESPIILAAHYDTRMIADHDPDVNLQNQPVPGANDGASGVAVLLEIARVLPEQYKNVWLVFFDTEDQGRIKGWDWILGSKAYAENLKASPKAVIVY